MELTRYQMRTAYKAMEKVHEGLSNLRVIAEELKDRDTVRLIGECDIALLTRIRRIRLAYNIGYDQRETQATKHENSV